MASKKNIKKEEKLVKVYIPKQSRNDTQRFVAVNGKKMLIQTGKIVEVPAPFASVIRNSEDMAEKSLAFIEKNITV